MANVCVFVNIWSKYEKTHFKSLFQERANEVIDDVKSCQRHVFFATSVDAPGSQVIAFKFKVITFKSKLKKKMTENSKKVSAWASQRWLIQTKIPYFLFWVTPKYQQSQNFNAFSPGKDLRWPAGDRCMLGAELPDVNPAGTIIYLSGYLAPQIDISIGGGIWGLLEGDEGDFFIPFLPSFMACF